MATHHTVLIVDDEESILLSLQRILELSGDFEVLTARSAREAWDIINTQLPDLILSDIAMPETDGIEFCRAIRNNELTRNLPFIFLTAKSERLIEGFKAGGDDFILKPFNFDEVMVKIEAIFRRMRNIRELATQLRGSLTDYSLDDILQMCHEKSISGSVVLYNSGQTGTIVVEKGDIKDVKFQGYPAARALDALRLWNEGMFVVRPVDFRFKPELMKKKNPIVPRPEFNDSILLTDGVWWVGHRDMENRVQVNAYLRLFERDDRRITVLVDPGPEEYYAHLSRKVQDLLGSPKNIQVQVLTNADDEWNGNWRKLHQLNDRLVTVTSRNHLKRFIPMGINIRHVKLIDSLKKHRLKLVTDHRLHFLPTSFCPVSGSFMLYDPHARILFSGAMFGSNLEVAQSNRLFALESDWDAIRQFHQEHFPTGKCLRYAIDLLRQLEPRPTMIAPQFGLVWRETVIDIFFKRLQFLNTGLDLQMNRLPYDEVLRIIKAANQFLDEAAKLIPSSQIELKIQNDPLLMAQCVFKDNQIMQIVGLPQVCLSRLVATLVQGEDAATIKQIRLFARGAARAHQVEKYLENPSEQFTEDDLFGEE
jgi:CheY-like chemotaxis protein